ncbi:hypothetical protein [Emticicia agri]|uniref:Lipoprotein n=1 Tax=Emticicia agri TaxID=2492393 RepID=A0A4Q5LX18_9BACT|nr:hypothetical protein [Emticicia agri]RYU94272.1 hypothetical protein EWM59_17795 [Emticicia agri]
MKNIITVLYLAIALCISSCNTQDNNNLILDASLPGRGPTYNVFEKNKDGLILPKYNFIDYHYKSLNDSMKAYYYHTDQLYLKSFLAFPEKYAKNTFISFSDDTISISQKLKISIYNNDDIYRLFYKNYHIITKEVTGRVSLYYVPVNKTGMNSIKIKQKSTNRDIVFNFWVIEENRLKKDSVLFYNITSVDSIGNENIRKILYPD